MTTGETIDYRLAANIQIPLSTMLGWWHSVNPHFDFIEALVRSAYELGPSQWEAPDWVLAQIALETGNGLSDLALTYKNFGGIGVSGVTDPSPQTQKPVAPKDGSNDWLWANYKGKYQWVAGLSKPDVVQGVEMMIAHRKAYTDPNFNKWASDRDPRYRLAALNLYSKDWPIATDIFYFGNGRWAADTDYAPKIVAKFKAMRAGELATNSNHFMTSMSQLQIIYNYKRVVPELAAHLRAALARIDELEQVNQHLTAQLVAMNDYYGTPEDVENEE